MMPPTSSRPVLAYLSIITLASTAACLQPMPTSPSCGAPGASVACACIDGARGAQVCQPNGTYAPCQCSAASTAQTTSAVPPRPAPPQPAQQAPTTAARAPVPCDPAGNWILTRQPRGATNVPGADAKPVTDRWTVLETSPKTWAVVKKRRHLWYSDDVRPVSTLSFTLASQKWQLRAHSRSRVGHRIRMEKRPHLAGTLEELLDRNTAIRDCPENSTWWH